MGWEERVREGVYTSPKGFRIVFQYEDVEQSINARGTIFEFPTVDGAYVQRSGLGPRRLPLTAFFSGDNHDLQSDAFMAALGEAGIGKLEHPRYGTRNVVPLGEFSQRDDLKTAANQSVVQVLFVETTGAVYPSAGPDPLGISAAAIADFNSVSVPHFGRVMSLNSALSQANEIGTISAIVGSARANLRKLAAGSASVLNTYQNADNALTLGIDTIIGQPLSIASQLLDLIQSPAKSLATIDARLSAYGNLIADMLGISSGDDDSGLNLPSIRTKAVNDFHTADLSAMAAISGSAIGCLDTKFTTRPSAIAAATTLLDQLDTVVAWRDERGETLTEIDTGETYQAIQEAVALTAGYLIQISFSLLPERRLVLDRDRTILDVCAQLYGSTTDERLNFLINTNALSGSQILELKRGTSVVYYA